MFLVMNAKLYMHVDYVLLEINFIIFWNVKCCANCGESSEYRTLFCHKHLKIMNDFTSLRKLAMYSHLKKNKSIIFFVLLIFSLFDPYVIVFYVPHVPFHGLSKINRTAPKKKKKKINSKITLDN